MTFGDFSLNVELLNSVRLVDNCITFIRLSLPPPAVGLQACTTLPRSLNDARVLNADTTSTVPSDPGPYSQTLGQNPIIMWSHNGLEKFFYFHHCHEHKRKAIITIMVPIRNVRDYKHPV